MLLLGKMFLSSYELYEVKLENKIQEVVLKMKEKGLI